MQVKETTKEHTFTKTIAELIKKFIKLNKSRIIFYVILLFIGTILGVVGITRVSAMLMKSVSANNKKQSIRLVWAIVVLSLLLLISNWGIDRLEGFLGPTFRQFSKQHLLMKVLALNSKQFQDTTPPIRYRAYVSAVSSASFYLFETIIKTYIPNIILLFILASFLAYLNVKYFGIFLVGALSAFIIFVLNKSRLLTLSSSSEKKNRNADGFAFDILSTLRQVISRNTVDEELKAITLKMKEAKEYHISMNHQVDFVNYGINLVVSITIFCIMFVAVSKLGDKVTNVVGILTALGLVGKLRQKLSGLSSTNIAVVGEFARGEANEMSEVSKICLDTNQDNKNSEIMDITQETQSIKQATILEFKNVSFRYTPEKPLIQNFSWVVHANKINILRASSGKGKTTLAKLVLKFYTPDEGHIFFNGIDISKIKADEIRQQICFINADLGMLNRSVMETMMYALPKTKSTKQHVLSLWKKVKHLFKLGLEDSIGNQGSLLSTGQKQALRVINAVMSDADVLILDEPASGLHPELKLFVLDLIKEAAYTYKKTVWLITHSQEVEDIGDYVHYM